MNIDILGIKYPVRFEAEGSLCSNGSGHWGRILHYNARIILNADLDDDVQAETLLHECLHGLEASMNINISEDDLARLSRGIFCLMLRNPELMSIISGQKTVKEVFSVKDAV